MPPSASSRKRPALSSSIQPSITSYFATGPSTSSNPNHNHGSTTSNSVTWRTHNPPTELPPSIKSGLLNVGMRVRKAVPEGLKSGTYKAPKLTVTVTNQENVPRKNKREHQDQGDAPTRNTTTSTVNRPLGQVAIPKSLTRRYHTAVPRAAVKQDTVMEDSYGGDDFEEAGFLQPVV